MTPEDWSSEEQELFEAGGFVDRCAITLRVFAETLEPARITEILGCAPSRSWQKGDDVTPQRPDGRKSGGWLLAQDNIPGSRLEAEIHSLLDRISSDATVWHDLHANFDVDLFCGIFLERWNRGFAFSPILLRRLAERSLHVSFDIYAHGDDDEN